LIDQQQGGYFKIISKYFSQILQNKYLNVGIDLNFQLFLAQDHREIFDEHFKAMMVKFGFNKLLLPFVIILNFHIGCVN